MASPADSENVGPTTLVADQLALPADVFVIPDDARFLLFAPFTQGVASVNQAAVRRLRATGIRVESAGETGRS